MSNFVSHHKDALEVLGLVDGAGVDRGAHALDRRHAHHLAIGLALVVGDEVETCQNQGVIVVQRICVGEGIQFLLPLTEAVQVVLHIPGANQARWIPGLPDL